MKTDALIQRGQGSSIVHRLDPRVKVVAALLMILGIAATPRYAWPAYPLLWAVIGSIAALGQIRPWRLARLGSVALPFTLAAVTLLFTTRGAPMFHIFGLTATDAGLARFLEIVLKSWLSVQAALLLTLTTPFNDLIAALRGLALPAALTAVISFMYRYLFILKEEAESLLRARAARSGTPINTRAGGSLWWRARVTGSMAGSLFIRSYERSERVYAAMLARGYTGEIKPPPMPPVSRQAILMGAAPVFVIIVIQIVVRF